MRRPTLHRLDQAFATLLLCVLSLAMPVSWLAAQSAPDRASLSTAIDSVVSAELDKGLVGVGIAVSRGGEILHAGGYGLADLEHEVGVTEETVFRIGSITKQFTAAAIMRLVEEGKLSLDDEITDLFPTYPAGDRRVTIHQLLTHTSGIRSYTSLGARWLEQIRLDLSHDEMLALFQDEPFDFEPGTEFLYNNSGYYLLGMIIEEVTGQSYADYLADTLFRPLGLESTSYCSERSIVKHRARGYAPRPDGLVNAEPLSMTQPFAAGALCSTALDLVRWKEALVGGKVVSEASYQVMTTSATLDNGSATGYGYGLALGGELEGWQVIGHGGGINGFITSLNHLPEEGLTVAVLMNTEGTDPSRLSERIMRLALGLPAEQLVKALPLTPSEIALYEGTYDFGPIQIRIFSEEGKLWAQGTNQPKFGLLYQGEHTFLAEPDPTGIKLVFEVESGAVDKVTVYQSGLVLPGRRVR